MPTKHPAGPFTVRVSAYSVSMNDFLADRGLIYHSRHRSPYAAGRRLAQVIAGRTKLSRDIQACILAGCAGRYVIESGDGTKRSLIEHRTAFCGDKPDNA